MTTQDHRSRYSDLNAEASSILGWTPADLQREAAHLATYYQGKGESKAQAWCSAATEAINVEAESRIA